MRLLYRVKAFDRQPANSSAMKLNNYTSRAEILNCQRDRANHKLTRHMQPDG